MLASRRSFIGLAIIVIVWYLGLSNLPQIIGTCFDGECGFSAWEIILSFAVPLAFFVMPVILEMALYKKDISTSLSDLGVARFSWLGIRLALVFLLPLVVFYPLFSLITNTPLATQASWQWRILNAVLINGLIEETMMRGFVFRHLREGRTFWRAAALATIFFAAYHLPLILSVGVVVGMIAVIIAIPTGFMTAYIYERGNNTVWGSALLHTVFNGLAYIFVFPADLQPIASSLYLVLGIVVATIMLKRIYHARYGRPNTDVIQQPGVDRVVMGKF